MDESTDTLARLHSFDMETLANVHDAYYPEIYRYARYRIGNPDRAEDIAAETFLRLLEALERGQGPRTNLRGWLLQTTSNLVNDSFRSHYRHPVEPLDSAQWQTELGPGPTTATGGRFGRLRPAIARLTEEQQHVISLRFAAGLNLKETAKVMDKGVGAVKSLQYRAISSLRDELGAEAS